MKLVANRKNRYLLVAFFLTALVITSIYFIIIYFKRSYVMVVEEEIERRIYASGVVKPERYIIIRADVSGYITNIYTKEGDKLREGDLLAEIDASNVYPQSEEIDKRLRQLKEKIREDSPFLSQIKEQIEMAKMELDNAERKYKRRVEMFREGLISREDLEDAHLKLTLAEKNYERLKKLYDDNLKNLYDEIELLNERKRKIKEDLKKYKIRAPISGYVIKKFINKGDYINHIFGENKLFILGSVSNLIEIEVSAEYINSLSLGQRVIYRLEGEKDMSYEGVILDMEREVDPLRRTIRIKVKPSEERNHLPNLGVEAQILVGKRQALLIPENAMDNKGYVEVKGRGKVRVKVGKKIGNYFEVLEGLKAGEFIKVP